MSSNMFEKALIETLNDETSITENGAVGFKTTGTKLLDLNFKVSSLRNYSDEDIVSEFVKVYYETPEYAIKWLFFLRDREQGMGERHSFRVMINWLAQSNPEIAIKLIEFIPEFGRWDDLIEMMCSLKSGEVFNKAVAIINNQLLEDIKNSELGHNVSLLAKWMPSENASSIKTKLMAKIVRNSLNLNSKDYRKILSKLRKVIDVVEVKTSSNQWDKINYNTVPSKANLKYNSAFLRNDEARRSEWLANLKAGKEGYKINSSVNFPSDLVNKYKYNVYSIKPQADTAIEEMWKALPDFVSSENSNDTIVVADGSGSMMSTIGKTNVTALDVAQSLAIYFSEKLSGAFANKYITFSNKPQYVDMSNCNTLFDKITLANKYDEVSNTNIEAVFNLILETAIRMNCSQDELPKNVLIVSDMEFDDGTTFDGVSNGYFYRGSKTYDAKKQALFESIKNKFIQAGYQMPRLIFWNVCSRSETIPLKTNDLGVALVSGFSPAIAKMVFSSKLDPWECLKESLDSERYLKISEAIKN